MAEMRVMAGETLIAGDLVSFSEAGQEVVLAWRATKWGEVEGVASSDILRDEPVDFSVIEGWIWCYAAPGSKLAPDPFGRTG